MCGRAACTLAPEEIQKQTQAKAFEGAEEYRPSYNIAPHQMHVAMLLDADGQPILKLMRWGLVRFEQQKEEEDHSPKPGQPPL